MTTEALDADLAAPAFDLRAELERHHADCVGWALACCAWDRQEADDVLQATYLKVLDGRAVYAGRSAFRTWLFAVVRRTSTEHRRRNVVRDVLSGRWLRRTMDPAQDAGTIPATELAEVLTRLPRRQREVLHLVFYQDLTIEDAATVLHISLGSARTHYERGKARLRRLLSGPRR